MPIVCFAFQYPTSSPARIRKKFLAKLATTRHNEIDRLSPARPCYRAIHYAERVPGCSEMGSRAAIDYGIRILLLLLTIRSRCAIEH